VKHNFFKSYKAGCLTCQILRMKVTSTNIILLKQLKSSD